MRRLDQAMYIRKTEEIRSLYRDVLFDRAKEVHLPDNDPQLQFVERYLPVNKDVRILDAGCGNGQYIKKLHQWGYQNSYGIDLFKDVQMPKTYACASINALPFSDETFDLIYSLSVIFYLDQPIEALMEFFRVLRPGGHIIISGHTKYSLFTFDRVIRRMAKSKTVKHLNGVKFYSSLKYKKMMEQAGLHVIHVDGFQLSYMIMPFIKNVFSRLIRCTNIPSGAVSSMIRDTIAPHGKHKQRHPVVGYIRSMIAYHAILVGLKPK